MKKILITILLVAPIVSFAALNFDTTADTINHGSGASIDNLGTFTWAMWVKPRTGVGNDSYLTKNGSFSDGKIMLSPDLGGDLQVVIGRATTDLNIFTTVNFLTLDAWNFMVFTFDGSTGTIYGGSNTSKAVSIALNGSGTQGSGAISNNDAASDLILGVNSVLGLGSMPMEILWFGVWNRALSLAEIQSQQFYPRKTAGNVINAWAGFTGMSTIADWSGSGNTGTISGLVRTFSGPRVKYR